MAYAMRINFTDVLRDGTLRHFYLDGKKAGYQFDIRLSYYRGHFLSVIDEFELKVDGKVVDNERIMFCLNGKEFGISQLHDLVSEFWCVTDPATIKVIQPGSISDGEHEFDLKLMFHSPYMPISDTDYMPVDGCDKKTLVMEHEETVTNE
ncbi:MAG: DUF6379 domain-containing protein [Atopobiaceae bacterium]|jgi:hypothetical protein|nr:DUF6379 domain-containing protein [Atopobiaceae bacterium]MCH4180499.1 DUF6379 domain-containing protein [Atopobiaceae bacterium]MCH4214193.1 DUF6379 domain-containing protein [Atopobiaceae bacterium]MCH4229462.1 DUF6379 domain-containing protein [Atopobiaceae bacterium]MCH4275859.1 DUF6379 domain-containing protein [Atopobiaceae bacterium]